MSIRWTQETILIKLKELHPNLDFSKFIYKTVNDKSIVVCPTHGSREMKVMNLLRGASCKLCRPQSQKRSTDQVILKFKEVHGDRYVYPEFEYLNQYQNIVIICKEHGPFTQQIVHHSNGSGCEKCHDRTFNRKDLETHLLDIPEYQKERYEYLDIHYNYIGTDTYLEIKCKKRGHIFFQRNMVHKNGSGCIKCFNIDNQSKGMSRITKFLKLYNINYIREKTFPDCKNPKSSYKLRFDLFIEEFNCCIEFDGIQHFKSLDFFGGKVGLEETKYRDQIKNDYCKSNNLDLIRIKYNDENIENTLKERLEKYEYTKFSNIKED